MLSHGWDPIREEDAKVFASLYYAAFDGEKYWQMVE